MSDTTAILKQHGLKVTPQRLAIFTLLKDTKIHPSAETLYKLLQPQFPTMSLATVYKTLDVLTKHHLIQQLNVGEDSFRYDADISDHAHLQCTICHNVVDLHELKSLQALREEVSSMTNYKLSGEQLYFYGKCPNCQ